MKLFLSLALIAALWGGNADALDEKRFLAAPAGPHVIVLDDNCMASTCPAVNPVDITFQKEYAQAAAEDQSQGCYEETVKYVLRDETPPHFDCTTTPNSVRHLLLRRNLEGEELPACPSDATVAFCDYQGPGSLPWSDNCSEGGEVAGQANPEDGPDECADTNISHTWTGPSDDCGNQADDKAVTIKVSKGAATYTKMPDGGNVNCGEGLPTVTIKKALCNSEEDFHEFIPTTDKTCGDVTVGPGDLGGTCGEDLSVKFTIIDDAPPKFKCKDNNNCPANANVCSVPAGSQLCASDCQYENGEKCFNATESGGSINVCSGGTVTRTWNTGPDGCGNDGDTVQQTLTVPAQGPSPPTKKADPMACGNLPEVCVDVPVCGSMTPEKRCASASGNGFTFGAPSPRTGCSSSSGARTVKVTYKDPVTGCSTSEATVQYSDKCCCKSDTAYVQYDNANGSDHCILSLSGVNNWGWYFGSYDWGTSFSYANKDIGAGRGQCNLATGYKAGTATINYNGATKMLTVTVTPAAGVTFGSGNLWVGPTELPKDKNGKYQASPGQYGNPLAPGANSWTVEVKSAIFYFAIHLDSQRSTTCSS